MATPDTCQKCDQPLAEDSRQAFCPKCLFLQASAGLLEQSKAELSAQLSVVRGQRRPTPESIEPDLSSLPLPPSSLGEPFGDYTLLEEIGRGGMGVVYRARQRSLDRVVAIKLMAFGPGASPGFSQRFRAEAVSAASLHHPNIVAIHEVGIHEGQHFFVMDCIEGQSLARLVGSQPLPARHAASYLKTIAEAVHYAHERGILHRDLKPSNILIDEEDQPHVVDFGLARQLEGDSELTITGQVLGSPNYLPPEQATGQRARVSRRTDVYALGATLYHLLTARPPFQAESLAQTLDLVLHAEPVPPRLLNPSVPRDLETICLKCLEKEPSRRYPTANAIAEELGRFLNQEPILARPLGTAGRAWRWCRRNPRVASAAAIALVSLVTGLAGVTWQWRRATASELSARQNAYAADMNAALVALGKGDRDEALFLLNGHRPKLGQRDLRGWEWRYLWQHCRSNQQSNTLPGSLQPVVLPIKVPIGGFGFSPDGKQFIALDLTNGAASLWETATVRHLEDLPFLGTNLGAMKWSPDGKMLAVGDESGNLRVWDFQNQTLITNFVNEGMHVRALRFAGGGRSLWCGLLVETNGYPRRVRIWSVADWRELVLPAEATNRALWAVVSPDNRTIAALGMDGTVNWWNLATGRRQVRVEHHFANSTGFIVFSPDSWILAGSASEGFTTLWDVATGQVLKTLRGNFRAISGVAFSPDGQRLISGGKDPSDVIRLMDVRGGRYVAILPGMADEYWFVEMSSDSKTLVAVGLNGTVLLWQAPSLEEIAAAETEKAAQ